MSRTYLIFADIVGKLDVLRRSWLDECKRASWPVDPKERLVVMTPLVQGGQATG